MKFLVLALAASAALASAPAAAATYAFAFTGAGIAGAGTLTTSGATITGISGLYNGAPIDQLYPAGTVVDSIGDVTDNIFSPTPPYLTPDGFGFGVAADALIYNLYRSDATSYALYISDGASGTNETVTSFTVAETLAPVPEAASWVVMLMGLGMVGAVIRQRNRISHATRH